MKKACAWIVVATLAVSAGCSRKESAARPQFRQVASSEASKGNALDRLTSDYGVPIYTGATLDTSRYAVMENPAERRLYVLLVTADPPERVVDFYKNALGAQAMTMAGATSLKGKSAKGADVNVNVGRDRSGKTTFSITAFFPQATTLAQAAPYSAPITAPRPTGPTAARTGSPAATYERDGQPGSGADNDAWFQSQQAAANTPPPLERPPIEEPPPMEEPPVEDPPLQEPPPQEDQPPQNDAPPGEEPPF